MCVLKACIFDLDGVLVDTAVYHYKAWKRLANELGFDFTHEQNEQLKGISRMESLALILEWGGVQKNAAEQFELATLKNNWYVDMIRHMQPDEVLPGARAFLMAVRAAGLKTALGSASKNATAILEKTELLALFDVMVDGNQVTASKPNPEVFLRGASGLGVEPQACVVFEDAIAGIAAAKAGGMKAVGIGDPEILKTADLVVPGLDAITIEKLLTL
ncbi:beta-phosphoglucomutase [Chitinophaga pendula]|uniref:beta-phosphoglucomutase n=1 Tax=Chitinophaga TaxID=79328 RepID=UPI000BAF82EE|nr:MULTISPECIES: beta-phosphoglucomutase [Chitinophaga]ASZ12720.1 beta-phosphoglucomutase [Chitinophaga sp. MD30]UCJ09664.1 beta-phosphoglucomutase [Chitinophaga pendula]